LSSGIPFQSSVFLLDIGSQMYSALHRNVSKISVFVFRQNVYHIEKMLQNKRKWTLRRYVLSAVDNGVECAAVYVIWTEYYEAKILPFQL
jgi:hypothetical protein